MRHDHDDCQRRAAARRVMMMLYLAAKEKDTRLMRREERTTFFLHSLSLIRRLETEEKGQLSSRETLEQNTAIRLLLTTFAQLNNTPSTCHSVLST